MATSKHIEQPPGLPYPQSNVIEPEDVDLIRLVERALKFFNRFKWLLAGAIVLGALAGYLFYRSMPKVYQSKILLHSFILTNQEHIQIINNWNELLQRGERDELATILGCPRDLFNPLLQIKAEEIQKVFSPENPNGFTIQLTMTDTRNLDQLEKAIVYGLENSPYIKDRISVKKASLVSLIGKTKIEIGRLDSTKKMMENIIGGSGKSSSPLIIDGTNINRQLIEMNEKLSFFEQDLEFARAVQVLQHFSNFHKPVGPRKLIWVALGIILFVALAWLYAFLLTISERIKARKLTINTSTMTVL